MTEYPARAALIEALWDWRRNAAALVAVVGAFGVAAVVGTGPAFFAAGLVAFTVWMAWFVLTTVEWVRLADF